MLAVTEGPRDRQNSVPRFSGYTWMVPQGQRNRSLMHPRFTGDVFLGADGGTFHSSIREAKRLSRSTG
jgi:hypothetical protein